MKTSLSLLLCLLIPSSLTMASDPPSTPSTEPCPTFESECTNGRFKDQCTILDCVGRQIIVIKDKRNRPKTIIFKSPCFGEKVVYRRNDIDI